MIADRGRLVTAWQAVVGVAAALLLVAAEPLKAQRDEPTISLSVGYSQNDFRHITPGVPFYWDFREPLPVLTFSGEKRALSVSYGKQPATADGQLYALTIGEAQFTGGPNLYVVRTTPVGIFLPIRGSLEYRFVSGSEDGRLDGLDDLHHGRAALGIGAGAKVRLRAARPWVVLFGSVVSSIGVQGEVTGAYLEDYRVTRNTEVNADLRLGRIFGDRFGITVGYTFRSLRLTNVSPETFNEVWEAIQDASGIPKRRGQSILRLGLNW